MSEDHYIVLTCNQKVDEFLNRKTILDAFRVWAVYVSLVSWVETTTSPLPGYASRGSLQFSLTSRNL